MADQSAAPATRPPYVRLLDHDNVVVLTHHVDAGDSFAGTGGTTWTMPEHLDAGNKLAAREIAAGEKVIKVGVPIGTATQTIGAGALVHAHNLRSDYIPIETEEVQRDERIAD